MIYGDLQIFDIIIFAGIAVFLVFRLRNVLGKRTGFEKNNNQEVEKKTSAIKSEPIRVPEIKDNYSKLKILYEVLEGFNHQNFLEGAKSAFETIINAFNKGDKKTLKGLVTPEVFVSFEKAIDDKSVNPDYQFFSLNIDSVEDVVVENDHVNVCIKFISEQFKNNDENTIIKKEDVWTFQKLIKSKNPNWMLAST
tara:strand:- start:277 stop:861 length:585 start_codon:yes stop_codon:yes gene_type:complete